MKDSPKIIATISLCTTILLFACSKPQDIKQPETTSPSIEGRLGAFGPLPQNWDLPNQTALEAKITLGRILYFEKRLSKNQDISCNSCHQLDQFGVDKQKTSPGHKGQRGTRNSPTSLNAAGHLVQFWDGRSSSVEEQAKGPILNPVEMAMPSEAHVVGLLKSMPEYEKLFSEAFPGEEHPVTYHNMAIAIGAFERRLVTPSRWDAYLKGDKTALTPEELKGFEVFTDTGCQACHMGPLVGGAMYQKLGLVKPWPNQTDTGKMEVTKQEADRMMFKVPSLRNVEHTAPYFHDGSVDSLDTAVALMAEHQLGRTLDSQQISAIVTWLKTLSANPAADYVKEPELPARTPSTPLADPS